MLNLDNFSRLEIFYVIDSILFIYRDENDFIASSPNALKYTDHLMLRIP